MYSFLGTKKIVKIGDFGLMTAKADLPNDHYDQQTPAGMPSNIPICSVIKNVKKHTSQIGTAMYMAPEMKNANYSLPVDIYALGVILYELFSIFSSNMDRAIRITNAKEQIIQEFQASEGIEE